MDTESEQIEDLKKIIRRQDDQIEGMSINNQTRTDKLKSLITELADALEKAWSTGAVDTGAPPLIRLARKITK